jgi:hypothetical protein
MCRDHTVIDFAATIFPKGDTTASGSRLFHAPSRRLDFRLNCRHSRPQGLDEYFDVHDVRRFSADRRHADLPNHSLSYKF